MHIDTETLSDARVIAQENYREIGVVVMIPRGEEALQDASVRFWYGELERRPDLRLSLPN